jgi:PAS domain S-box-containing protein
LRSTNEKRRKLWTSILDESCFSCCMPVTPYRSFPASEVQVAKCQRTILGIDAMIADTSSLHVLLCSLVDRTMYPDAKIDFRYTLVTEESVVAGNQVMARWVMSTTNAMQYGAKMEVSKSGMLCCKFNSSHRIIGLELMFDVMAFMLQLKQAAGSDNFPVIPNTVQTCQRVFDKPMVFTLAEPPYTIVQVNKHWENMTGYSAEEVVGKASCKILQGPSTPKEPLSEMMQEIRYKRPYSTLLKNCKKTGEKFNHYIVLFPLSTDSRITHYLALSTHVGSDDDLNVKPAAVETIQAQSKTASFSSLGSTSNQTTLPPGGVFGSLGQKTTTTGTQGLPNMFLNQTHPTPIPSLSLSMAPPPNVVGGRFLQDMKPKPV